MRYLLQGLNDEEAKEMKRMVSHSEEASENVLGFLAKDDDFMVRAAVAGNEKTPIPALRALADDDSLSVQIAVASNEKSPEDVLSALTRSPYVRSTVAFNKGASEKILSSLFEDHWDNGEVRMSLAKNVSTPKHILKQLAELRYSPFVQAAAALNPNIDPEVRVWVATRGDFDARMSLAYGEKTPPDVLEILSKDPDETIRKTVTENENTPDPVLKMMASGDRSESVRLFAKEYLAIRSKKEYQDLRNRVVAEGWLRFFVRHLLS